MAPTEAEYRAALERARVWLEAARETFAEYDGCAECTGDDDCKNDDPDCERRRDMVRAIREIDAVLAKGVRDGLAL